MFRQAFLLTICLTTAFWLNAETTVYKSKDANGNPIFTDKAASSAETLKINDPITFPAEQIKKDAARFDYQNSKSEADAQEPFQYETLQISSPANEETIRQNAGNLQVDFIGPKALAPQHQLELLMDGAIIAVYNGGPFILEHLDRGTHILQLQISDSKSGEIYLSSPSVQFTLLRFSKLR